MNIVITGGTGMVGSKLTNHLLHKGHHVYILTRNASNKQNTRQLTYVKWLGHNSSPEKYLPTVDAVINLAGASISQRWTPSYKALIRDSRIEATREVIRIINSLPSKPEVLINASAIGYYGTSKTNTFTEESKPIKADFLHRVCKEWENEAAAAKSEGVRVVYARFGLILANKEGALSKMVLPYYLFIGGPLGTGDQWYSWVHVTDVINMIAFAVEHQHVCGPINVTAPSPERMHSFGKQLANTLQKPHWLPTPAFAVRAALGEMSTLILDGQKVLPEKPLQSGYTFSYPSLHTALDNLFDK
ncbi:hypothetical protein SAMN05192534_105137 [Alteribacillus persepolensis]|uniref:TIGR01777 family protein n=1 Tax=Alteribacillus persepolensis TaxID=568899 RepID=A0A1G8CCE4_9BACI|nr:TIGR01777 family oxidoreductase [Alteribacillus persepolensis]SDH43102.1 hypothetical protein SAMN05192534_105137 [Alteribacillus persepolensis]